MSEWISVEDRLPEKGGCYITADSRGHIYISEYSSYSKDFITDVGEWFGSVYYWMPLPDPPINREG